MNELGDADVIRICGDEEDYLWLSEKAQNRLSWILSGLMILVSMPVLLIAFLM